MVARPVQDRGDHLVARPFQGAAAGGIALVNSIGNLGGFVGPSIVGWIKDSTHSYEAGLDFLAASALTSGIIAFFMLSADSIGTVDARLSRPRGQTC